MEPKFETRPAFLVVGLPYFGKNENNEIPQLWDAFIPRMGEIENAVPGGESFGICSEPNAEGDFEYVAALPVSRIDTLPEGMVARLIPQRQYAVFTHQGSLEHLHDTYQAIYQGWLPGSGYEFVPGGRDFELYRNGEFEPGSPDSKMYIYLPVKEA